jgi:hypothetical protein
MSSVATPRSGSSTMKGAATSSQQPGEIGLCWRQLVRCQDSKRGRYTREKSSAIKDGRQRNRLNHT